MPGPILIVSLICVIAALAVAEFLSLRIWNRKVTVRCSLDMNLVEPGEEVTLRYRLCNTGFCPLPSVSLSFSFDQTVEILDANLHETEKKSGREFFTVNTCLRPHRVQRGTVHLAFRERGVHELGRVYVECGDFLGLRSAIRAFDIPISTVCTARPVGETLELEALGGLLGDISVRRFIMEDPSLILGYREYTGCEPMKSISWVQTARTGQLMVKNHDFTVDTDVVVLVDIEATRRAVAERCLSLTRTVCDELEHRRIPYSVYSNGDLFSTRKGEGRAHMFEIQRRIGVSRFLRHVGFSYILNSHAADSRSRGYIIVAPALTEEITAGAAKIQAATGMRVCVLSGEEGLCDA